MNKKLSEIIDSAEAKELETLLEKIEFEEPDEVSFNRIRKSVLSKTGLSDSENKNKKTFKKPKKAFAAACFAMLAVIIFGACAAEAKEYSNAITFFNENDLSAEGLSRGEIKAVYRDITTESFSYTKTAEVIENSISQGNIPGLEIFQEELTHEDIQNLWNYKNFNSANFFEDNTEYRYRSEYRFDEQKGFELLEKSCFEKYNGEELIWSVPFAELYIEDFIEVSGGTIIYGRNDTWSSAQRTISRLAKISDNGEILWEAKLENGFEDEYIAAVLENSDGSYAVFSRGDFEYFCLSQYSAGGELLSFCKTEIGNYGIWNAALFGDGYIVQLGSYMTDEYASIYMVDRLGNLTESFSYSSEDAHYYITDMIEFGGNIYLSAYAVPKSEEDFGGRYEIASVLDYIFENNKISIESEELTPLVKNNYTALLLVCDPGGGEPMEFYSVKGSLGGTLSANGSGNLLWEVEDIVDTYFSPATSAFSIGGTCRILRYTFGETGILISREDTGETIGYAR
ncbi:MAG: hypothetical protein IJ306_10465 [Oscillospiraceae bacterium]|nr:hypothetical protein [Oscillospiraceae bacterium]